MIAELALAFIIGFISGAALMMWLYKKKIEKFLKNPLGAMNE